MKAFFKAIAHNQVRAQFDDISGERIDVVFHAPTEGGYVRAGQQQICEKLGTRGITLKLVAGAQLIDVIRSEYRAMRRSEKRLAASWASM